MAAGDVGHGVRIGYGVGASRPWSPGPGPWSYRIGPARNVATRAASNCVPVRISRIWSAAAPFLGFMLVNDDFIRTRPANVHAYPAGRYSVLAGADRTWFLCQAKGVYVWSAVFAP